MKNGSFISHLIFNINMFYKILKNIEEKDSLPIGSIIEIENDIKFIHLD